MDRWNKRAAAALIAVTIVACGVTAARRFAGGKTAVIYKNGEIIRTIRLDRIDEPEEFDIMGEKGETNTVRAERGRIRVISADCPDKICVNQGWIEDGAVPIVCLPNGLTIEIRGVGEIDAVTGGV